MTTSWGGHKSSLPVMKSKSTAPPQHVNEELCRAMFTYFPLFEQHFRAITEAEAKAEERGEEVRLEFVGSQSSGSSSTCAFNCLPSG